MHSVMRNERSLSVLCADVASGDWLSRFLDRREAQYAVGRYENRIQRSVERNGGRLVGRSGGRTMAFFGNNVAALQSAIEIQHRVADLPPSSGVPLAVRIGVCTGHQWQEARYFSNEGDNPAVSLSGASEPGQILLSIPKRMKLSPWLPLTATAVPDLALNCGGRQLGIFVVSWRERAPLALKLALSQLANGVDRLALRYRDTEVVLDGNQPVMQIGRHVDCGLLLRDARSSRLHGTIERRLDRFVFLDRSTNGTFVTLEDQTEFLVRGKPLPLFGRGQLSFGMPSSDEGAELLQFETSGFA